MERNTTFLWNRFTLREALLLGFCATFIVITRAALRMKLGLPGHAMFFMMFFLLLARGCVPKLGASTVTGLIAGMLSFMLGMGKDGPLLLIKFLQPAIFIDIAVFLYPAITTRLIFCIFIGAFVSATRAAMDVVFDMMIGMDTAVMVWKNLTRILFSSLFGAAGAALAPSVVRRLQANRLIPGPQSLND